MNTEHLSFREIKVNYEGVEIAKMPVSAGIQSAFEAHFGMDQQSRTPAQWRLLVKTYGIAIVMKQEGMTGDQVVLKCHESFRDYTRRQLKNKIK